MKLENLMFNAKIALRIIKQNVNKKTNGSILNALLK